MDYSEDDVQRILTQLARKMGSENASRLLSNLGKDRQFVNAIENPLGQELMKDAVLCIEEKLGLWLSGTETAEDRAEVNAYLKIIKKWQGIINNHNKNRVIFDKNII